MNPHTVSIGALTAMGIAAISGLPIALARGETLSVAAFHNTNVLLGLAIGVGMNVVVNPIEIFAFKHLDAVFGSQILLLDNVFALLLGFFLYHEIVTPPELIGGAIIIGSVYLANKLPQ